MRHASWLDTRARFVASTRRDGTLLDLGSSDGETLRHLRELRPDLNLIACDLQGAPEAYPPDTRYLQADLVHDVLDLPNNSVDAVTCMHLVEHLSDLEPMFREVARVLVPGGRAYFETPHAKTVDFPHCPEESPVAFTLNFYDDSTHVAPVLPSRMQALADSVGLQSGRSGISRNLVFALSHLVYRFRPWSRQRLTAYVHWRGWSAYAMASKASK